MQRGPVDAAGAAAGKGQQGATGRTGVVTAMVAGRSVGRGGLLMGTAGRASSSPAMNQRHSRSEVTSEIGCDRHHDVSILMAVAEAVGR